MLCAKRANDAPFAVVVANAPMAADEESSGDGEEVGKFGECKSKIAVHCVFLKNRWLCELT